MTGPDTAPMAKAFTLSDNHRRQIEKIDPLLVPWLAHIEAAILAYGKGYDRKAAFVERMADWGNTDWQGRALTDCGDPAAFADVAKAAADLMAAMRALAPWRQMELGGNLAAYGDSATVARLGDADTMRDIAPDLAPYAELIARLGQEATDLTPGKGAGQPRRYQRLVSSLVTICAAAGVIDTGDIPTGAAGKLGRLFSLCLQAAGVPDSDQPDHGKALRAALRYIIDDEVRAAQDFAQWEGCIGKKPAQ